MRNENPRPATPSAIGTSFDEVVLPHLGAARRLARWLMRNDHDAEDVVQEASLRAFRYFRTFAGGNGRAWFLRIVRNTSSDRRRARFRATFPFDEKQHSKARPGSDPETLLLHTDDLALVERAMRDLPDRFRELLVLRELQGLPYQEIATVMGIPVGTVMSGLSRARQAFREALKNQLKPRDLPEEDRAATPGLSETIQEQIGAKLKALFDQAADQPVPDRFVELLQELASKEDGADDEGHELP